MPSAYELPVKRSTRVAFEIIEQLGLQASRYEGPTGIVGVFQDACVRLDVPAVNS